MKIRIKQMCWDKLNYCGPDLIKGHIMKLTLALLCAILQVISAAQVEIKPRGVEITQGELWHWQSHRYFV